MAVNKLRRYLANEAGAHVAAAGAKQAAAARRGQVEVALGPGEPNVTEAALLLEVALLHRTRVREHALLAADHQHRLILEALGVMQGHEGDHLL